MLFDEAHGQRFLVGQRGVLDLSRLADEFRQAGARVDTSTSAITPAALSKAHVMVVSGAFSPLQLAEQDAILEFLQRGGSLAVMLHIGPPVGALLKRLGVIVSNGVIRESDGVLRGNPIDFRVTRLARHPMTAGLSGIALFGAWALLPETHHVLALATTEPHAWVDLNRSGRYDAGDAMQSFVVTVAGDYGRGRFVVFGDDAMFQNQFLLDWQENRRLAENLAAWLLGREHALQAADLGAERPTRVAR